MYWYEKAAEQGDAEAQCNCGAMYYNGDGTAVDEKKAKMWFEKAAAQTEDEDAQIQAMMILRNHF